MKPFCETFVSEILPVVKAVMAKKMMEDYKLSQNKIAEILEITQPAISQYKRSLRGRRFEVLESNQKVLELMERLTRQLAFGELSDEEKHTVYCRICRAVKNEIPDTD